MRNTLIITFVLIFLFAYFKFGNSDVSETVAPTPIEMTEPHDQASYSYNIKYVDDVSQLKLISNLDDRRATFEIIDECRFLVNGGFYSKEYSHIGLLISEYQTISEYQSNNTFNGFIYFDTNNAPHISSSVPTSVRVALQSGPVIMIDSKYTKLRLANDKDARRVLAATTNDDKLAFMIIYKSNSQLSGPLLADLPTVLDDIQQKESIEFVSAINLDGGSASAFYDGDTRFAESSIIGSYFCLTD